MAVLLNGKRPHGTDGKSKAHIIDLTFSDEERPSKRQRSESRTTPPLLNGSSQQHKLAIAGKLDEQPARKQVKCTTKPSPLPPTAKSSYVSHDHRSLSPSQTHDAPPNPEIWAFQKPKGLSNGISNLSLRPSSRPKRSRSPDVIDLDTDSDQGRKPTIVHQPHYGSQNKSATPKRHIDSSQSVPFFTQDLKPIRFDPTSPLDIPKTSFTSTSQFTPRTNPVTARRPFIRLPTRAELPSTSGARSQSTAQPKHDSYTPSKPSVIIQVPPHPSQIIAQSIAKSKDVVRKLKQDVTYIREHPEEVSKFAGVLPFDDTPLDKKARRKAKQVKHKKVSRNDSSLEFSSLSLQSSTPCTTAAVLHPRKQARQISQERFSQSQGSSITFENRRNERQLNGKFQFVSDYIPRGKVKTRAQIPLPPRECQCIGGCGMYCGCLTSHQTDTNAEGSQSAVAVQPYHRRDDGLVVLSDSFIEKWSDKVRIFECGEFCSCPPTCVNRVVQKGRKVALQIFETRRCGFGVRSSNNISRGQFIDLYLGEVITPGELEKREAVWEEDTPSYVLSLDVFISDEQKMYHVDGGVFGSVTRFVNHSCEPNCTVLPIVLSSDTKQIYHVAFFAIKDIPAGTELTIDYDPSLAGDDEALDAAVVQCRCGSKKCRKRLWRPGKEKRGRKRTLPGRDND